MAFGLAKYPLNRLSLVPITIASRSGNGIRFTPSSFRDVNGITNAVIAQHEFFGNYTVSDSVVETLNSSDFVLGNTPIPPSDVTESITSSDITNATSFININDTLNATDTVGSPQPSARVGYLGIESFVNPAPDARIGYLGIEVFANPNPNGVISFFGTEVWFDYESTAQSSMVQIF